MKILIILPFSIAILCLAVILMRKKVRWHSDIIFTDKGKEELDPLERRVALLGFIFLLIFFLNLAVFNW